jgi:hypothetical protein
MSAQNSAYVGNVNVFTENYRGHSPEVLAELALDKIIYVGENAHPLIAEQAKAFRENIREVLIHYMRQAQESERTTIAGAFIKQGRSDLANIIRSI